MRNIITVLALALTIIACSKPTMDDEFIAPPIETVEPVEPVEPTVTATTTVEETTTSNVATATVVDVHDDGKGNITYTYEVTDGENEKVIAALVDGESQYWFFGGENQNRFQVHEGGTFELFTFEYETLTYRGIEMVVEANFEADYNQLDRALDLAGDNWETNKIYVYGDLGNFGWAGLARGGEFVVSFAGFETHVMLHENGHNYDFNHDEYRERMTDIYPEGGFVGYYTSPVAEFRAEMFARYYLLRDMMPQLIVDLLDRLLN